MGSLFGGGDNGAAAMHADNVARQAKVDKENQDLKQQEARRQASQRRARSGASGSRSLLSNGYGGIKDKNTKLGG